MIGEFEFKALKPIPLPRLVGSEVSRNTLTSASIQMGNVSASLLNECPILINILNPVNNEQGGEEIG
jgi:hypothetical protein